MFHICYINVLQSLWIWDFYISLNFLLFFFKLGRLLQFFLYFIYFINLVFNIYGFNLIWVVILNFNLWFFTTLFIWSLTVVRNFSFLYFRNSIRVVFLIFFFFFLIDLHLFHYDLILLVHRIIFLISSFNFFNFRILLESLKFGNIPFNFIRIISWLILLKVIFSYYLGYLFISILFYLLKVYILLIRWLILTNFV